MFPNQVNCPDAAMNGSGQGNSLHTG
jgi:hypothetical protein